MAMLAEPRRRQKWSVDPRNSTWSKDESKFGQKMLEKMGWSKGKGLGAQEQGNTEHIRVQLKNNNLGLGASVSQEDNWIAHQDDFNQLLAELNNCHGQDIPEALPTEDKTTFSLEEKSKTSRKRVHYMKFAKGKDLSSRSEDDLSCIFGKRLTKKNQADAANTDSVTEEPKEEYSPPEQVDSSNTVTSTLTVQEYFAKRMAKLGKARQGVDTKPTCPSPEESEHFASRPKKRKCHKRVGPKEEEDGLEEPKTKSPNHKETEEVSVPKKKKKKSKHRGISHGLLVCNGSQSGPQEDGGCHTGTSDAENDASPDARAKKKNKKKHQKLAEDAAGDVKKTKSKKKKHSS